ncbi:MAG: 2,3-bisphosphoglycerate-independent phosphoglycerate mutase [Lentisphaeria bacterium]|nr:2,3-bisphosphoglycerate-independent phosphoglycerate mutase [Lentisphaeria bacterium]
MTQLRKHPTFQKRPGPVLLCIMDGVGYGTCPEGDAVASAGKPSLDWLHANAPNIRLKAHGSAVGMPAEDDMGNSEIGHNAIGCGRVFAQGAKLVNEAVNDGTIFDGTTWGDLTRHCVSGSSTLHFIGLLSDGNVHSHIHHLFGMLDGAAKAGVRSIRLHTLLDGRDVGETSALEYIEPLEEKLAALNGDGLDCRIASGGGRMHITMDRYGADWAMVERGWNTHVRGDGRTFGSARQAIETLRHETGAGDQDLQAFVIADGDGPVGPVRDGDAVILYNFRGDRSMELCAAFENDDFPHFDRAPRPDVMFAGMMQYDGDLQIPRRYLVEPPRIDRTVGEFLGSAGVRQMAISETQKYGHVTYFFNGNRTDKFDDSLENYIEIPSDLVPFEQRPWMKAAEITDAVINEVRAGSFDFARINFPNGDMVGHTGDLLATEIAVEVVDLCMARLMPVVEKAGGVMVICADHGNADEMYERKNGEILMNEGRPKMKTSHSLNPVPCIIYDPLCDGEYTMTRRDDLGIANLSATCLNLLGFEAPEDYLPSVLELT